MNSNAELDAWRLLWQAEPEQPSADDLRDRVARETRRRTRASIVPILITVVIGGWVLARARQSGAFADVVLAIEAWLFIAVVWTASFWIARGTRRPLGDSTTAFLDLSIRRCQSALMGLRVAVCLYPVQLGAVLSWKLYFSGAAAMVVLGSWPFVVLGWLGVPGVLAFYVWYSRRKGAELAELLHLRDEVRGD